jgi:hypothetical protein
MFRKIYFYQTTQCHIPEGSYVCIYMLFSNIAISHMVKIKGNEQFMYLLLHHSKNPFCRLLESDDGRQRDNRVHEVNTAERGRWKGSSEWSSWWGMHYGVFKGRDVGSFFRCCRKGPRVLHPLGHLSVDSVVREKHSSRIQGCWESLSVRMIKIRRIMFSNTLPECQPSSEKNW